MAYSIWFVPSNSSHMGKNSLLLRKLEQKDGQIHLLCLDNVLPNMHSTLKHVKESGFPFEILPASGYRRNSHWIIKGLLRARLIRNMREMLSNHRIDVLLFGADTGIMCTVIEVARSLGIPTILIPDGLIPPDNPQYRQSTWQRIKNMIANWIGVILHIWNIHGTSSVDWILVINEMGREALIKRKVEGRKIKIVGSPEYDALAKKVRQGQVGSRGRHELCQAVGIEEGRPIVFFAHQPLGLGKEVEKQLIDSMVCGARECGATLLVKFHPRASALLDKWHEWKHQKDLSDKDVVFVKNECTSTEAAWLCSACVTVFSTVALEALICGKPVVLIQYLNVPVELPYGRVYNAAIEVHSPKDLKSAIVSVINDLDVRKRLQEKAIIALEKELLGPDGKSVDRMVENILSLIQKM